MNNALFLSLRAGIQRKERPDLLLRYVSEAVPASGLGYDFLDELLSGILQVEDPRARSTPLARDMVFYQPTPARHIFQLIHQTALTENDVLVDLGSGLGHVPILVSICTGAGSIGIEIEKSYVDVARQCAQRLNLEQVRFTREDARMADLSNGTVFYLSTPFTGSILEAVLKRLQHEAATRLLRVCTFGPCTEVVACEPWLVAKSQPDPGQITLFRSR